MNTSSAHHFAGNDNPIMHAPEDRYGFTELAEKLSASIISLDRKISTVIGIEGKWGAGKTSLLNLLMGKLTSQVPAGTHVLRISPWLSPSGDGAVEALLLPVAAILDTKEAEDYTGWRKLRHKLRKAKASPLANSMLRYAQQASGQLAPLAAFAGNWVPGASIAASALKTVSTADLSARRQTTAELREEIEKKMATLGLSFIVVLDDLDRLEPDQAVEVLRLIRAVADFSGFHYVICYDPVVLGHAVERGLGVTNGRLYLQKIVQLSFSLPLPEPFDLRHEFLTSAAALYTRIHGDEPAYELYQELKEVTRVFGATLSTPREVRLALGNLAFRYESLRKHVCFPDLCLLQLLRATHPELYLWVELYLTMHAMRVSGSGTVSENEMVKLATDLQGQLDALPPGALLTLEELSRWLPGIPPVDNSSLRLFHPVLDTAATEADKAKRLSSSFYWRYYFAFTPPKDVLSPGFFDRLFHLADSGDENGELTKLLFDQITDTGFSSRTGFEQIIDRLTPVMLAGATPGQCRGLLTFIFRHGNKIIHRYSERGELLRVIDIGLQELADRLIRGLIKDSDDGEEKEKEALELLRSALQGAETFSWSVSYLRHLLWQNGLAGNRPAMSQDRVMADETLKTLRFTAAGWLENPENRDAILANADLSELVYAWQEISSTEAVATWMASVTREDKEFLKILLSLRHTGVRSDTGRYQGLRLSSISDFFKGGSEAIQARINSIRAAGGHPELVRQVQEAIDMVPYY